MDMGGGRVMRKLAVTLSFASRGIVVRTPSEEALSNARSRLGAWVRITSQIRWRGPKICPNWGSSLEFLVWVSNRSQGSR